MENAFIEQFRNECYEKETTEYMQAVMLDISNDLEQICENMLQALDDFFRDISEVQQKDGLPVTFITVSFMYTSVYFNRPAFRFDAYDDLWYWGECLSSATVSADWLYTKWEDYQARLHTYIKEHGLERHIREERLKQFLYQTMKTMVYQGMLILKYILPDCIENENYSGFVKNETFCLSYGEYKDWQRTVFVDQPKILLSQTTSDIQTTFQFYENQELINGEFQDMDCSNSKFIHCYFKNFYFQKLILNDCTFENCTFEDVKVSDIQLFGVTFINCTINKLEGDGLAFGLISRKNSKNLYKMADFIECEFENLQIKDSDLSEINFEDCTGQNLEVMNCSTSQSNFDWVEEEDQV